MPLFKGAFSWGLSWLLVKQGLNLKLVPLLVHKMLLEHQGKYIVLFLKGGPNHNKFLSIFPLKSQGNDLLKFVHDLFQDAIHFHPQHPQLKALVNSFNIPLW